MRKIVLIALSLFAFLSLKATGLTGDWIYIDGEEWTLLGKPIESDSLLYVRLMDFLPEDRITSTANWDGYTAYWKIEEGNLYLQHINVYLLDTVQNKTLTHVFSTDELKEIFSPYYTEGKICAYWFSGQLRIGKGECLIYMHSGFSRYMETEQIIEVKEGKVMDSRVYHNYKKEGIKMEELFRKVKERFPWEQFPEYRGNKLYFHTHGYDLTSEGRLVDCDVFVYVSKDEKICDANHPLVKAFKDAMRSVYPLEVFFINGKFVLSYDNWTLPLIYKGTKEVAS